MNNITKYCIILLLTSCATNNKPSLQSVERLCGTGYVDNYYYSDDESITRINCQEGE